MPISFVRESIEQPQIVVDDDLTIVQKKVELRRGMRHEILACDIYQDTLVSFSEATNAYIECYVSPFPIIYSNMDFAKPNYKNRGPSAASDTVLFKAILGPFSSNQATLLDSNQFPSPQIGAGPSFSFYTPFVYFTVLIHTDAEALSSTINDLSLSFMLKVKSSKASVTQYGLGMIRERSVAQGINLLNQGRTIPKAGNVGQIFPSWKYGGIRPERMLRGNASVNFFINMANDQAEDMENTATIRGNVRSSRQMAAFDEAFGRESVTVGGVPDWIRFGLNRGLVSGPIRSQQPPRKLADNGNTLML